MLSRRKFVRRLGTVLAAAPALSAVDPWAIAPDDFESLRRGVGTFTQRGGTIGWLVNDDGLVVVDTQYSDSASDCWAGLQERTDHAPALVINTHHHGDHVSGNPVFAEQTDRIVAHSSVPDRLRNADDPLDEHALPQVTFEESWEGTVGDETITLRHYGPAHTGGDAVVFFEKANVVHVGDLVFNRAYPFIDIDGGADSTQWIDILDTLHGTVDDDTIVIHGHGNPEYGVTGGRDDLLVMRDFLAALNEYVTRQRQAGASREEMKQKEQLDGFEAFNFDWPLSLAECIEVVHREQTEA